MTRETFDGAALRGEQEAQDERKGSLTDQLWRAVHGARKALDRADALRGDAPGPCPDAVGYGYLAEYVREIADIVDRATPKLRPLKHRCGCTARLGGEPAIGVREPLRSHLAKQDCPECRTKERT